MNKRRNTTNTDPSVNDVLAQQLGTEYADVENHDKEALQKELTDQAARAPAMSSEEDIIPSDGATDDRNTSDGQLIGY